MTFISPNTRLNTIVKHHRLTTELRVPCGVETLPPALGQNLACWAILGPRGIASACVYARLCALLSFADEQEPGAAAYCTYLTDLTVSAPAAKSAA